MWDLSLEKQTLLHERVRAAHTKTSHALGGNEPFQHKKRCSLSHGNNSSVPCEGICFSLWELGFSHSPRVQCMSALGVFGFLLVSLLVRAPCHVHTATRIAHLKGMLQQQRGSSLWSRKSWFSCLTPLSSLGNSRSLPASRRFLPSPGVLEIKPKAKQNATPCNDSPIFSKFNNNISWQSCEPSGTRNTS